MRHSLERGAILAVGGELVLPTGDETKGFGKGTTVLESFVLYGKLLPRDAFVQLQAVLEFPNDSSFEDEARPARRARQDLDGGCAVRAQLYADNRGARRPRARERRARRNGTSYRSSRFH